MKLRCFLIISLVACAWFGVQAAPVSETAARGIAEKFMQEKGMGAISTTRPAKAPRHGTAAQSDAAYYVFNGQDKGFVIVSGDDRTLAVLGYSDIGHFDANNVPPAMQGWLDLYAEELALLDAGKVTVDAAPRKVNTAGAVRPLLRSKWGQNAPFNFECPVIDDKYCVTGCTATAMAQIMYYHKWPAASTAIPGYTKNEATYDALEATDFDWDSMQDYYDRSETETTEPANAAVARLMRYCGQAVEMNYGTSSSGANAYSEVFAEYFSYSRAARKLYRLDYTYDQWTSYILAELAARRPILYVGRKHSGGHAFVLDGYDGNGYFHFNWGWYGSSDGYFTLSSLNPKGGGTGSIAGDNGYTYSQEILIGLEPNMVGTTASNSVTECYGITMSKTSYTRTNSASAFTISANAYHYNQSTIAGTYDLGWGLYDSDGYTRLQTLPCVSGRFFDRLYYGPVSTTVSFGENLPDGTYYLRPICRETGNDEWLLCLGSGMFTIEAQINGNTLTLTPTKSNTCYGVTASITGYSPVRKKGRPLEVTLNVTNDRIVDHVELMLFVNDELVATNAVQVDRGSSGTATIVYTPKEAGTNTIKVCADRAGNEVYCIEDVEIEEGAPANLKITYNVPSANDNYQVAGTKLTMYANFKNNMTTDYTDLIIVKLFQLIGGYGYQTAVVTRILELDGGASATQQFDFENLAPGQYYARIYYYNYDEQVNALRTVFYEMVGVNGDVNGDGFVSGADVTALYNVLLDGATPGGDADVNGDGIVNGSDVTALYNLLLN